VHLVNSEIRHSILNPLIKKFTLVKPEFMLDLLTAGANLANL